MAAFAQLTPRLDEFPMLPGDATIVRTVDQDYSLVYAHDASGSHMVLYDHANYQAFQFSFPSYVQIRDRRCGIY